ncbi:hypothetical protein [Streptomyces flaveolus]|uniref:hypothetical protein n=1 Tax=Streptomyces flaveolus TaxID=67297 RepID=UPI0033D4A555
MEQPHLELVKYLDGFQSLVAEITGGTAQGASGDWPQAYVDAMKTFMSGDGADYISGLRDTAAQLADGAREFAYQLDYTNMMIILQVLAFLLEWAITLMMWEWNPIGAAIEQGILLDIFEFLFGSTLRRFLTHAAINMVTNLTLSTALDGLAQWILALQGKHTNYASQYHHSAVLSGAIQGAIGSVVPVITGSINKLISKGFSPSAIKSMQESIENSLKHPAPSTPAKSAPPAADGAPAPGAKTGSGLADAPLDKDLADLSGWFGPELAKLSVPMRIDLAHNVVGKDTQQAFRKAVGDQFERAFGSRLGSDLAREMGTDWASAFLAHANSGSLSKALKTSLEPMEKLGAKYEPLRSALSTGVGKAMPSLWKQKPAHLLVELGFGAGYQNLSEGIVNYIEQGQFTTSKETTTGALGGEILGRAKHPILGAVHSGIKGALHLNVKLPQLLLPGQANTHTADDPAFTAPPPYTQSPGANEVTLAGGPNAGGFTAPPAHGTSTGASFSAPAINAPSFNVPTLNAPTVNIPTVNAPTVGTPALGAPSHGGPGAAAAQTSPGSPVPSPAARPAATGTPLPTSSNAGPTPATGSGAPVAGAGTQNPAAAATPPTTGGATARPGTLPSAGQTPPSAPTRISTTSTAGGEPGRPGTEGTTQDPSAGTSRAQTGTSQPDPTRSDRMSTVSSGETRAPGRQAPDSTESPATGHVREDVERVLLGADTQHPETEPALLGTDTPHPGTDAASPHEATVAPHEATVAPHEATVAPHEATVAPQESTVAPHEAGGHPDEPVRPGDGSQPVRNDVPAGSGTSAPGRPADQDAGLERDGAGRPEDTDALGSFHRLWGKTSADHEVPAPLRTAVTEAYVLLGGAPEHADLLITRFARHIDDFGALAPADRHVAIVAQKLLRGTPQDVDAAVQQARSAGITVSGPERPVTGAATHARTPDEAALKVEDRPALDTAKTFLGTVPPEDLARAEQWARTQVSNDHTWFLDGHHPDAAERRELLGAFVTLLSHSLLTDSVDAARALSLDLAQRYGTRRTKGLPGGVDLDEADFLQSPERFPTAGPSRDGNTIEQLMEDIQRRFDELNFDDLDFEDRPETVVGHVTETDEGLPTAVRNVPEDDALVVEELSDDDVELYELPNGHGSGHGDSTEHPFVVEVESDGARGPVEVLTGHVSEPGEELRPHAAAVTDTHDDAPESLFAQAADENPNLPEDFRDLMRPIRSYIAQAAAQKAEKARGVKGAKDPEDAEVILMSYPGAHNIVELIRTAGTGHAFVAVRLPGREAPVNLGFRVIEDVSHGRLVDGTAPGGVTHEAADAFDHFSAEILRSYKVDAEQLEKAYQYAEEKSRTTYNLIKYNCVVFAQEFVHAATGADMPKLTVNAPNSLIEEMRVGTHRDWVENPRFLELTPEDRLHLERAHAWLNSHDRTSEMRWALDRVFIDHQRPVVSGTPDRTQQRQLDLLAHIGTLAAEKYHHAGEAAALQLLHDLGVKYGTSRHDHPQIRQTVEHMLEPLRSYAEQAADPAAKDAEVVVMADQNGRPSLGIKLPGHPRLIGMRFGVGRQDAGALGWEMKEGSLFLEHSDRPFDPDIEILKTFPVGAAQVLTGYRYALDNIATPYKASSYNSFTFTQEFLTEVLGSDPVASRPTNFSFAKTLNSVFKPEAHASSQFHETMQADVDRSWSKANTPVTELTDTHKETLDHLAHEPVYNTREEFDAAQAWAKLRVALDHQKPSNEQDPETGAAMHDLLRSFRYLIAATYHTQGEHAARQLSWRLGTEHGTWRSADKRPPEPQRPAHEPVSQHQLTQAEPVPTPTEPLATPEPLTPPHEHHVLLGDVSQPMTDENGFHRFDTADGGTVFISNTHIDAQGAVTPAVANLVTKFLNGGLPIHRVHPVTAPRTGYQGEPVTILPAGEAQFPRHDDVESTSFVTFSTTPEDAEHGFRTSGAARSGVSAGLLVDAFVGPDQTVAVIDDKTIQVRDLTVATFADRDPVTVFNRPPQQSPDITVRNVRADENPYKEVLVQELSKSDLSPEQHARLQAALNTYDAPTFRDVTEPGTRPVVGDRPATDDHPAGQHMPGAETPPRPDKGKGRAVDSGGQHEGQLSPDEADIVHEQLRQELGDESYRRIVAQASAITGSVIDMPPRLGGGLADTHPAAYSVLTDVANILAANDHDPVTGTEIATAHATAVRDALDLPPAKPKGLGGSPVHGADGTAEADANGAGPSRSKAERGEPAKAATRAAKAADAGKSRPGNGGGPKASGGASPKLQVTATAAQALENAFKKAAGSGKKLDLEIDGTSIPISALLDRLVDTIGAGEHRTAVSFTGDDAPMKLGKQKLLLAYEVDDKPRTLSLQLQLKSSEQSLPEAGPSQVDGPSSQKAAAPQVSNEAKFATGAWFSQLMKDKLQQPVMLAGGGQIVLKHGSPRPLADLDFRAEIPHVAALADRLNEAIVDAGPQVRLTEPFKPDAKDKRALTGWVNDVEITVGPSNTSYKDTVEIDGIVVASDLDAVVDKAFSFAVRSGEKQQKDLFDLLWSLRQDPAGSLKLHQKLDVERGAAFRRMNTGTAAAGNSSLSGKFTTELAKLSGPKNMSALTKQWKQFGADEHEIVHLTQTLDDLKGTFRAGPGPHRNMIVTAGNFTGDMFGTAAALVVNPKLHVTVLTGPKHPDQVGGFLRNSLEPAIQARYQRDLVKLRNKPGITPEALAAGEKDLRTRFEKERAAEFARVHVLYSEDPHGLYTSVTRKDELLPHELADPPVPENLRSVHLQRPVAHSTHEVTERWGTQGHERNKIRAAWGLSGTPDTRATAFLAEQGVPDNDKYVVLWSRFSGKNGGAHPQHDTSVTGLRQIIDALPDDVTVIIAGDKRPSGADRYQELAQTHPNVFDLTEFWKQPAWRSHFPNATRADQFKVFDSLAQKGADLKHLGFRSGNLEPYALIGHQVRYLEEAGNLQAGRLEPWHSTVGYERITISKVPTLTGQWVTHEVSQAGGEPKTLPWRGNAPDPATTKHETLTRTNLTRTDRGFAHEDLAQIGAYLGFSPPTPKQPTPTTADHEPVPSTAERTTDVTLGGTHPEYATATHTETSETGNEAGSSREVSATETPGSGHSPADSDSDSDGVWYDAESGHETGETGTTNEPGSADHAGTATTHTSSRPGTRPWMVSDGRYVAVTNVDPETGQPVVDPITGEPQKQFVRVPYAPSPRVFRMLDGRKTGLTPVEVRNWLVEEGVNVPPGPVREAVPYHLYEAEGAEVVYQTHDTAQLLQDLRSAAHTQLQTGQNAVIDAVVETSALITEKYPPSRHFYLGLGRSPAAVIAALQTTGHQAGSVPLSDFRPAPEDNDWSIFRDAFKKYPALTDEQRRMLHVHFDEFVRPHIETGKDIVLIDYTQTGLSLFAAQHYLSDYLTERGFDSQVKALALHQDIDAANLGATMDAIRAPRSWLKQPLDWYYNTSHRIEWGNKADTLALGAEGALAGKGPVLGQAFKQEAFDGLAEHGSYKLLQQTPQTFRVNRPLLEHAQHATGYHALKGLVKTHLSIDSDTVATHDTAGDKGKARATEPDLPISGIRPPSLDVGLLTADEAETIHDHLRQELDDNTYQDVIRQASGIVGSVIDMPPRLEGGLADTHPAAYSVLTNVAHILAAHQHDQTTGNEIAGAHATAVRDAHGLPHATPKGLAGGPVPGGDDGVVTRSDTTQAGPSRLQPAATDGTHADTAPAAPTATPPRSISDHVMELLTAPAPGTHEASATTSPSSATRGPSAHAVESGADQIDGLAGETAGHSDGSAAADDAPVHAVAERTDGADGDSGVPVQAAVGTSPPGELDGAAVLSEMVDEADWWRIHVPAAHQHTVVSDWRRARGQGNPGDYYDAYEPGHTQRMLNAYHEVLENQEAVARPLDSGEYARLYSLVNGLENDDQIPWSQQGWGSRPPQSGHVSSDLLEETLLGRPLITRNHASLETSDSLLEIITTEEGPWVISNYRPEEIPHLIDAVFTRHYQDIAATDSSDEIGILTTIARTMRALTMLGLAQGSEILHENLLLPKLLLEQGFPPATSVELQNMFHGDHTATEIAHGIAKAMSGGEESPRPSEPSTGAKPTLLSEHMPEKDWWRLYIDPAKHDEALQQAQSRPELLNDPGVYFDFGNPGIKGSPGYQKNMIRAYREVLDNPKVLTRRLDADEHQRMHAILTGGIPGKFTWSAGKTAFPLRNEIRDEMGRLVRYADLSADILEERLLGRRLVAYYDPKAKEEAVSTYSKGIGALNTNHSGEQAPLMVDAVYERYYEEIAHAGNDRTAQLSAIARAVRALMVIHPFTDANSRLNIRLVLPKLLLQQGFPPVYHEDFHVLFQGSASVETITHTLNTLINEKLGRPEQTETAVGDHTEPAPTRADTNTSPSTTDKGKGREILPESDGLLGDELGDESYLEILSHASAITGSVIDMPPRLDGGLAATDPAVHSVLTEVTAILTRNQDNPAAAADAAREHAIARREELGLPQAAPKGLGSGPRPQRNGNHADTPEAGPSVGGRSSTTAGTGAAVPPGNSRPTAAGTYSGPGEQPWVIPYERQVPVVYTYPSGETAATYTSRPYEPSSRVFRALDDGRRVGLTPRGVRDWLANEGLYVPPGPIREAVDEHLYGTGDGEVVYQAHEIQQLLGDLRRTAHTQLQSDQDTVIDAVVETSALITGKYPPATHFYLGLGRSPAAIIAALQETGHSAQSFPLSSFRPSPVDGKRSIFQDVYAGHPPLTDIQRRMLSTHFDEFVHPYLEAGKDIVLIDYTQSGLSLFAAQHYLGAYLAERGFDGRVKALAVYQHAYAHRLNATMDAIRAPRSWALHPRDWYYNRSARIAWGDAADTLSLDAVSALADKGSVLGKAMERQVFDGLAEHGSYKLLEQNPHDFEFNRPLRSHSHEASGYQTLKGLIKTHLTIAGDAVTAHDSAGDKGKARAIEPDVPVPAITPPSLEIRLLSADEAEAIHDHLKQELDEDTYRHIVLRASDIVGSTIDMPPNLDGGLAHTNPAAHSILTDIAHILAHHQNDPAAADALAHAHTRTLRDRLGLPQANPKGLAGSPGRPEHDNRSVATGSNAVDTSPSGSGVHAAVDTSSSGSGQTTSATKPLVEGPYPGESFRDLGPDTSGADRRDVDDAVGAPVDKGKERAYVREGDDVDRARDEGAVIDAGAALTSARLGLARAESVLEGIREQIGQGVGGVDDDVRLAQAYDEYVWAGHALSEAEAHWFEVTNGEPLPQVQRYDGPGLGGGMPSLRKVTRTVTEGGRDVQPPASHAPYAQPDFGRHQPVFPPPAPVRPSGQFYDHWAADLSPGDLKNRKIATIRDRLLKWRADGGDVRPVLSSIDAFQKTSAAKASTSIGSKVRKLQERLLAEAGEAQRITSAGHLDMGHGLERFSSRDSHRSVVSVADGSDRGRSRSRSLVGRIGDAFRRSLSRGGGKRDGVAHPEGTLHPQFTGRHVPWTGPAPERPPSAAGEYAAGPSRHRSSSSARPDTAHQQYPGSAYGTAQHYPAGAPATGRRRSSSQVSVDSLVGSFQGMGMGQTWHGGPQTHPSYAQGPVHVQPIDQQASWGSGGPGRPPLASGFHAEPPRGRSSSRTRTGNAHNPPVANPYGTLQPSPARGHNTSRRPTTGNGHVSGVPHQFQPMAVSAPPQGGPQAYAPTQVHPQGAMYAQPAQTPARPVMAPDLHRYLTVAPTAVQFLSGAPRFSNHPTGREGTILPQYLKPRYDVRLQQYQVMTEAARQGSVTQYSGPLSEHEKDYLRSQYPPLSSFFEYQERHGNSTQDAVIRKPGYSRHKVGNTAFTLHTVSGEGFTRHVLRTYTAALQKVLARFDVPEIEVHVSRYNHSHYVIHEDKTVEVRPINASGGTAIFHDNRVAFFLAPRAMVILTRSAVSEHDLIHEIGHALHFDRNSSLYEELDMSTWKDDRTQHLAAGATTIGTAPGYAGHNPMEFVAEVFTRLVEGHPVSPQWMAMYTAFGGALPNR